MRTGAESAPRETHESADDLDAADWDHPDDDVLDNVYASSATDLPEPPRPINWNLLSAREAETEWHALDRWVNWLRATYSQPPAIIPPYWHRHPELVWELSALHQHWLGAYDPQQHGSAPTGWHRDFEAARHRLRDWVALSGTTLNADRATRRTIWPGETDTDETEYADEVLITDRAADFAAFVKTDLERRRDADPSSTKLSGPKALP